jgi:uncharacterized protein (DUF2141 family)
MRASARSATLLAALAAGVGATPPAQLDVTVAGLRSAKGLVSACLTARPDHFPGCVGDPAARRMTVSAADPHLEFTGLASGGYALSIIHDENANAKLDTALGIPTEGVGFSRNPRLMFGPPRFSAARLNLTSGVDDETVRMKYFL